LRMTRIRFPAEGSILRLTACTRTCGNKTWYRIGLGVLVISRVIRTGRTDQFFAKIKKYFVNFNSYSLFSTEIPTLNFWNKVKSTNPNQTLRPRTS
jgi:hypothetical protein